MIVVHYLGPVENLIPCYVIVADSYWPPTLSHDYLTRWLSKPFAQSLFSYHFNCCCRSEKVQGSRWLCLRVKVSHRDNDKAVRFSAWHSPAEFWQHPNAYLKCMCVCVCKQTHEYPHRIPLCARGNWGEKKLTVIL